MRGGRKRVAVALLATVALLMFAAPPASAAPPANDMFDSATRIDGVSASTSGSTVDATVEEGEPEHLAAGGASVWYEWTAPFTGHAELKIPPPRFDADVAVFRGDSVDDLDDVTWGTASSTSFRAEAGTTYRIAVYGRGPSPEGTFDLTLEHHQPPPNDDFEQAAPIVGDADTAAGSIRHATWQDDEPNHHHRSGASVWYRWIAPRTGPVELTLDGSVSNWGVYTGDSLDDLEYVAYGRQDFTRFHAEAGTTYHIALDGYREGASYEFAIDTFDGPANDDLADAASLTGESDAATGTTANASTERREPWHSEDVSVWYRWTAPRSGTAEVQLSAAEHRVAAYTGDDFPLTKLVGATGRLRIRAEAGQTYAIRVYARYRSEGPFSVDLRLHEPPPNDDFANAALLEGLNPTASGTTRNASAERGEGTPAHTAYGTVWYRWTAPRDGAATIEVDTSDAVPPGRSAVYTGPQVDALTTVALSGRGMLRWRAEAGTTYHIAIDDLNRPPVDFTVAGRVDDPPANDLFAQPHELSGLSGEHSGTNLHATRELGEQGVYNDASVWYVWRAPANGRATMAVDTAEIRPVLGIYTGSDVGRLTLVQGAPIPYEPGPTSTWFRVVKDATYLIRVSGWGLHQMGSFDVSVQLQADSPPPPPPPPPEEEPDEEQTPADPPDEPDSQDDPDPPQGSDPQEGGEQEQESEQQDDTEQQDDAEHQDPDDAPEQASSSPYDQTRETTARQPSPGTAAPPDGLSPAAPVPELALQATVARRSRRAALRRGLPVRVACSANGCSLRATARLLLRGRRTKALPVTCSGGTCVVRFPASVRRTLAGSRRLKLRIAVDATSAGQSARVIRTVVLGR